jgi:hypothetical protein
MNKDEILERLSKLAKGGITIKKIKAKNGNVYEYSILQWRENGKQKSKVIKEEDVDAVKAQLEERKRLETELERLSYDLTYAASKYYTSIKIGKNLLSLILPVKDLKRRNGYDDISDYVYGNEYNRVFILYGLRRTGKTTLIRQIIADMSQSDFDKTAYIQITQGDELSKLNKDLQLLEENGFKYVFIDEVTLMSDFIEGAALLSDIYAAMGMKIVLSGTDSLGFWISKKNELYDRCLFLHTTFIPYKEFEEVLGIKGIDNYIKYGGTMSLSGTHYNKNVFKDKESTDEYVDSAIAQNIQHSLKCYQDGNHFRRLHSLYEKDELTSAINRVVEDMNHRFTIEVLERDFVSNDLRLSARNLRKDRQNPSTVLDDIDVEVFTKRLKELLDIKNKEEQTVPLDNVCIKEIKEYLTALDLIKEIDVDDIDDLNLSTNRIVFTQPGLRFSQAKHFIMTLSKDKMFNDLSKDEKEYINDRVISEIQGRMMEDIVLLETKMANPEKEVFKLQFASGEFDMVVADNENLTVQVYEIKHSDKIVKEQYRHLIDTEKLNKTEFRYGKITKRAVIYRGKNTTIDDSIDYLNVEDYLKSL